MVRTVKMACLLVLGLLIFFPPGVNAAPRNLDAGIGNLEWGMRYSSLKGLKVLYRKGNVIYSSAPRESYSIGKYSLTNPVLGFYKGQLYAVHFKLDDLSHFSEVRKVMLKKLGEPRISTSIKQEQYQWKKGDVKIKLKRDDDGIRMRLNFYFRPISRLMNIKEIQRGESIRFLPIEKGKTPKAIPLFEF